MSKEKGKWDSVFEAHPDVTEIFVGKDKEGREQPFLKSGDAVNFAGTSDRVECIKKEKAPSKSTSKSTEPQKGEAGAKVQEGDKKNK